MFTVEVHYKLSIKLTEISIKNSKKSPSVQSRSPRSSINGTTTPYLKFLSGLSVHDSLLTDKSKNPQE